MASLGLGLEVLAADGDELLQVGRNYHALDDPPDGPEGRVEPNAVDHPRRTVENPDEMLVVEPGTDRGLVRR